MPSSVIVYIGLGSNLEDRIGHVRDAIQEIAQLPGTSVLKRSSYYLTPPMGPSGQADYINAVIAIETKLTPHALLNALKKLEAQHGRQTNTERWSSRPLDCDILLYGDQEITTPTLTIPHPGLTERLFVLQPLYSIAPELILPNGTVLTNLITDKLI